jgi:hypothetical protein
MKALSDCVKRSYLEIKRIRSNWGLWKVQESRPWPWQWSPEHKDERISYNGDVADTICGSRTRTCLHAEAEREGALELRYYDR